MNALDPVRGLTARMPPPSDEAFRDRDGAGIADLTVACLSSVLDGVDGGILVCNANGRALVANAAARAELRDGGVLQLDEHDVLSGPHPVQSQRLRRAVASAARDGRRQLLTLGDSRRVLSVGVQPVSDAISMRPMAVVLLGRRQLAPELALEMLASQHALTLAERRVLGALLDGQSVVAIARDHGVAESTVRTQAASLRAKFNVRRIHDLVRRIAELPPMMSALRGNRSMRDTCSGMADAWHA